MIRFARTDVDGAVIGKYGFTSINILHIHLMLRNMTSHSIWLHVYKYTYHRNNKINAHNKSDPYQTLFP